MGRVLTPMKSFASRWAPALGWMVVIFIVSSQPRISLPNFGGWDYVIKKSAHLAEYALLSIFMLRGVRGSAPLRPAHLAWALAFTVAYAATDEYHQTFIAGRQGHWPDVVIDGLGATIGLALLRWPPLARLLSPSPNKSEPNRR